MRVDRPPRKPQPPAPLPAGTTLGAFDVRAVLGRGPYGFVYRVWDPESESEYAVREYLPEGLAVRDGTQTVVPRAPDTAEPFAQGLRAFLNEGKLLSQLRHPALLHVYGSWEENGTAYLAMELVAGRNLYDTVQARGRPPREAGLRNLLDDLLGALEVLHAAGLQHRDVAPRSIVIGPNGRPLLMDLGTPRRLAAARGETGPAGPRDGYAPIEMYGRPDGLRRGPWTDVYGLGAIAHFLITGKPPAPAPQRAEGAAVAWSRFARRRYGLELLAAIDWMLSPRPQDRPQSVAAVRAALAGEGLPGRLHPGLRAQLGAWLYRQRRWLWALLGLLLLAAAAGALWRLSAAGLLPSLPSLPLRR